MSFQLIPLEKLNGEIIAKDFKDANGNSLFTSDKTKIKGSVIEADSLYVKSANITGTIVADELKGNVAKLAEEVTIGNSTQMPSGYRSLNFYNGSGNRAGISLDNQGNLIQNSTFGFNIISNAEFTVDSPSGININGHNSSNYISGANNYISGNTAIDNLVVQGSVNIGNSHVKSKWGQNLSLAFEQSTNKLFLRYNDSIVGYVTLT
jgi:hypothetical protein